METFGSNPDFSYITKQFNRKNPINKQEFTVKIFYFSIKFTLNIKKIEKGFTKNIK